MTQKDKVKELVGRGLHSYHTKALQQMDRIEKKNKEQNHKISILTNELDNDYLTKTEEGSVISLEHSKEGMVYLDELQGNTLVNYCTDGSKEMTLNGDIDVEGSFVTTTEGVDNGLVDVMCEGNTLVNLIKIDTSEYKTIGHASSNMLALGDASLFRNGIQYTIICEFSDIEGNARVCFNFNSGSSAPDIHVKPTQGLVKHTFTMPTKPTIKTNAQVRVYYFDQENSCKIKNLIILEGDWSNKELPSYFEGMKSVGQDDENGHKIEILSQNKNLFNYEEYYKYFPSTKTSDKTILSHKGDLKGGNHNYDFLSPMKVNFKPNTTYTLCIFNLSDSGQVLQCEGCLSSKSAELSLTVPIGEIGYKVFATDSTNYKEGISFKINTSANGENAKYKIMLVEGDIRPNDYIHYNQDKKEILLNEPLRRMPNEVKDRIVKIGGKWYIERNCGEVIFDGSETWEPYNSDYNVNDIIRLFTPRPLDAIKPTDNNYRGYIVCDKLCTPNNLMSASDMSLNLHPFSMYISYGTGTLSIALPKSSLISFDKVGHADWLSKNKPKTIYQLATPTYEEITDVELITYLDTTHISNNSIIPCNMKIQNTGYNVIIKPSTLYTVALDTNKSGTIGMNLGGVKGTTTNNMLTLTTPATLSDDSLRLYGKGIKGSKVRLLEGDKTNWIPSHFEGMKSSFEDKFDTTDNTYKMEILSKNKNYFNYKGELNQYYKGMSIGTEVNINTLQSDGGIFSNLFTANHHGRGQIIKVKPYTSYIIKSTVVNSGRININTPSMVNFEYGTATNGKLNKTFNTLNNNEICLSFHTYGNPSNPNAIFYDVELILESNDNLDYIPNKSNKIQFSSIEPLRGVENVRDRFVFKDNKLMIERNCKKLRLTTENLKLQGQHGANTRFYYDVRLLGFDMGQKPLCVENLKQVDFYDKSYTSKSSCLPCYGYDIDWGGWQVGIYMPNNEIKTLEDANVWLNENIINSTWKLSKPTYEEIPFELQKIILEGYENGTLFFDTNIPPTSTVTYAGETPIVKSVKLNKTEVSNNTNDINDNIIPYLMDMDYRVVCLQLESNIEGISMSRLFGGAYEMLKRDILSKRLTKEEYGYRLTDYFNAGKLTEEEVRELEDLK